MHFVREQKAGGCKIHDTVSFFVSAFTGALNRSDSAGDGNRMTLGARYISVPVIFRQPLFDHYLRDAFYPTLVTIV